MTMTIALIISLWSIFGFLLGYLLFSAWAKSTSAYLDRISDAAVFFLIFLFGPVVWCFAGAVYVYSLSNRPNDDDY